MLKKLSLAFRLSSLLHFTFILLVIVFTNNSFTQAQNVIDAEELLVKKTFFNLQEALAQPDSVFKLTLSRKKLKEIPHEVFTFSNLQVLNLSRNSITQIPADISKLKNLQELNLSNNKLTQLPAQIGDLTHLSKLRLNRNEITSLPPEIGKLINLEIIEMWDNELDTVPDEIKNLVHLQIFELRGILFSDEQQEQIHQLLPLAKIYFSPSCACKE